jgi:NAD(P)-dependent dehydrogenase (short-subunit alcohol dehydrogenase family)
VPASLLPSLLRVIPGYFHDCEPELYERQMSLNYMGSLHAAKAVYDGMLSRNAGHICFVASTMALMGEGGGAAAAAVLAWVGSDTKQFIGGAGTLITKQRRC